MSKSGQYNLSELEKAHALIEEICDALNYWMPIDEPLSEQTDNICKAHKSLWHKHQSLITTVRNP